MSKCNIEKQRQLGMPQGTASAKLRKLILFNLLKEANKNICYQCGGSIETVEDLSIEHKIPWLHSDSPKKLFFDLNNIGFSHLRCNIKAARRTTELQKKTLQEKCKKGLHPLCKLKEEDIQEIRKLSSSLKGTEIAEKYHVSKHTIYRILKGITFSYIKQRE